MAPAAADPDGPPKPAAQREVLTVTELTSRVRDALEGAFPTVWVAGEVSNLRIQPSGHMYFTLKDAGSQVSCVLFRGQGGAERGSVKDGVQLTLGGEITVYEPRGQYQLRVTTVELKGAGALQAAFERLKARLAAEGLFAQERKRPLPRYPFRVGLVTSPSGAALRDVLHVLGRRHAGLRLVLAPCRVQGEGAASEIAAAIGMLNRWSAEREPIDVLLVTRGGGSIEDLWCFNEEVVARAIVASAIPVLSAVGHEIDFTISDFAADMRAATPSAGAEILTQGYLDAAIQIAQWTDRMRRQAAESLDAAFDDLEDRRARLLRAHPRRVLEAGAQRLDELTASLGRLGGSQFRAMAADAARLARRVGAIRLGSALIRSREALAQAERRFSGVRAAVMATRQADLRRLAEKLAVLSPERTLARGYSITRDAATGAIVRTPGDAPPGSRLRTRLAGGEIESVVEPVASAPG